MSTTPPREPETATQPKPEDTKREDGELSAEQLDKVSGGTSNVQKAEHDARVSAVRSLR